MKGIRWHSIWVYQQQCMHCPIRVAWQADRKKGTGLAIWVIVHCFKTLPWDQRQSTEASHLERIMSWRSRVPAAEAKKAESEHTSFVRYIIQFHINSPETDPALKQCVPLRYYKERKPLTSIFVLCPASSIRLLIAVFKRYTSSLACCSRNSAYTVSDVTNHATLFS